MEREDHYRTGSYGNVQQGFRETERELIQDEGFASAFDFAADDVKELTLP
jgi:hypothetical protein